MAAMTAVPWPRRSSADSRPSTIVPSAVTATPPATAPIWGWPGWTPLSITATRTPRPLAAAKGRTPSASSTAQLLGSFGRGGEPGAAVLNGDGGVGELGQRRLVGDDNECRLGQCGAQIGCDQLLGLRVQRRGRLVQDQD